MSKADRIQAQFWELGKWISVERDQSEKMVGKLPPQDPCCVRSHVFKDVERQAEELWRRIEKILNTPDA
jgi:hypothetical protein